MTTETAPSFKTDAIGTPGEPLAFSVETTSDAGAVVIKDGWAEIA